MNAKMRMGQNKNDDGDSCRSDGVMTLDIITDASFAPGGSKSRTGVVILLNGRLVHWTSSRQSMVTMSTCESELLAQLTGVKLGLGIHELVVEFLGGSRNVHINLKGDNMAAMHTIRNDVTNWRTRHYMMYASWLREKVEEMEISLIHIPGKQLVADGLGEL